MGNWDTATPAGSSQIKDGDDYIREMKIAIQDALRGQAVEGTEAIFPGSAPTTAPVFRYRGLKGTTGARPAFGQYGLYFNTTLNTMQRDSGAAWENVATLIPATTAAIFYQAAAPTGWTRVTTADDKFLRVVSAGSPGTTGGSGAASASHTHGAGSLQFQVAEVTDAALAKKINFYNSSGTLVYVYADTKSTDAAGGGAGNGALDGQTPGDQTFYTKGGAGTTAGTTYAYADILIATKD